MKKIYCSWQEVEGYTLEILRQMQQDGWKPDYVVGLTRGGLVPANLISQYLDIPMKTLTVKLRDHADTESNSVMAEDAYMLKKILIVDDINDSGATLNWIKQDWASGTRTSEHRWSTIWNKSVKIATLFDNESSGSKLSVDYSAVDLNKSQEDVWIDFPWESWWKR